MIYNMEPVDRVINKIVTDLGLGMDNIPYADFIEWIADGLQHIGSYPQYKQKADTILICDYKGILPCDLDHVIRLDHQTEVKAGKGGFYGGTLQETLNEIGFDYESASPYDRFRVINSSAAISRVDNNPNAQTIGSGLSHNGNLIGDPTVTSHTGQDYSVNFNTITTSFQHGIIDIQYMAFAVDERGWPLVPDNVSYRDALFWKCAAQLSMRDPSVFKNPRLQDYEYCRQRWSRYCKQARAESNMPDVAMMERLKNNWLRLYNTVDQDAAGYAGIGKPQRLNMNGNG